MIICLSGKNEKLQTIFAMQTIAKYFQTIAPRSELVYAVSVWEQLLLPGPATLQTSPADLPSAFLTHTTFYT